MKRGMVAAALMLAVSGCVTDDGNAGYYDSGPYYGGGYDRSPDYRPSHGRRGYSCDLPGRGRVVTDDAGDCRRLLQRVDNDRRGDRDHDRHRDRDRGERERREHERREHAREQERREQARERERRERDRQEEARRDRDRDRGGWRGPPRRIPGRTQDNPHGITSNPVGSE